MSRYLPGDVVARRKGLVMHHGVVLADGRILHNTRARISMGVAQPLQGPGQTPVFYVGTAF